MTGRSKSILSNMKTAILLLSSCASSLPQTSNSKNNPRPPLVKQIKHRQKQRNLQQSESTTQICSCSPTKIQIILSLSQSCNDNDFKSNPGIQESYCFIDDDFNEDDLPSSSSSSSSKSNNQEDINDTSLEPIRRTKRQRRNQILDNEDNAIPVEIISVQYLEFHSDGNLKVINQDDTYTNVSLKDGDSLSYYSTSSYLNGSLSLEQLEEYVPGGASLILYGRTSNGRLVRNRFFWVYSNSCEEGSDVTVVKGDKIGWVTIGSDLGGAWPAFCPQKSIAYSPTISPRTFEPTSPPLQSPTIGETNGGEGDAGQEEENGNETGDGEEGENVDVDSATFMPTSMPASTTDGEIDDSDDSGSSLSPGDGGNDDYTTQDSSDTGTYGGSGSDDDGSNVGAKSQKPSASNDYHDAADSPSSDMEVNSKSYKPLFGKPGKPSDDEGGSKPFSKSSKSHSGKSDKSSKKYFRISSSSKSGKSISAKWAKVTENGMKLSWEGYPDGGVNDDDYGDINDYPFKPGITTAYKTMPYAYHDHALDVNIEDVESSKEDIRMR
eukprot:CAMPEP_0171338268 /NCGR_PEP_ID=MMETSP0878-20121228/7226_1 /TAXON_ID=67004 /ORGANISM="Thalassiosira weissflogii, Strain CCMP1336" /LENGTH=549 /DNA_ID=CAMNT_0011840035 /DNA_START=383 /DNA_END=2032 /DNA_ORIENTATION=+